MRFKRYFLLILLLVTYSLSSLNSQIQTTQVVQSTSNTSLANHTVKMGDTVYSIATAYKTTVEEINRLNPGSNTGINVGQVLRVPQSVVITREDIPNRTTTVATPVTTTSTPIVTSAYVFKHKIEAKETLFSVSQKYKITVGELLKANPGLGESSFSIGREIVIPDIYSTTATPVAQNVSSDNEHRVEKQETFYSISKKYDVSIEDLLKTNPGLGNSGLREGSIIRIPATKPNVSEVNYTSTYVAQEGVVRVGLLLPFIDGSKTVPQEKITEYYEGFLLAIQRMKERGLNAEIYTFDIGNDSDTKRLESILGTSELHSLNLIIGGVSDKQVQLISRFSQNIGIKYVVPFSNKNTGVEHNKNMFQVANSHVNLYGKITRAFVTKFGNDNIVFLSENGSDKNKMNFVQELQKALKAAGIAYTVAPTSSAIVDDISSTLVGGRRNIIIPTSSSEVTLKKIMPAFESLSRKNSSLSLFGYPDWQTYMNKTEKLHRYNSYMYGMFYLDNNQPEAQIFADRYKQWYNKSLVVSYPKFAQMGYDTGIVFLTALQRLGNDFSARIGELNTTTLQSALYFQPVSDQGGYINTGMYFINLRPDGSVDKQEISNQ